MEGGAKEKETGGWNGGRGYECMFYSPRHCREGESEIEKEMEGGAKERETGGWDGGRGYECMVYSLHRTM